MAQKRIRKQPTDFQDNPPFGCSISFVDPNNPFSCIARLIGPEVSPYAGGIFLVKIGFPHDYPFRPPTCWFQTPIYHPKISMTGMFCLRLFKEQWSPKYTIPIFLSQVLRLLSHPQQITDGCLHRPQIQKEFKNNRELFVINARQWTTKYAKQN